MFFFQGVFCFACRQPARFGASQRESVELVTVCSRDIYGHVVDHASHTVDFGH
jgi:hypothetical protein